MHLELRLSVDKNCFPSTMYIYTKPWVGFDWVSQLPFRLEMSRAAEIGSTASASLTAQILVKSLSFQHIFPYNFGSSLQK